MLLGSFNDAFWGRILSDCITDATKASRGRSPLERELRPRHDVEASISSVALGCRVPRLVSASREAVATRDCHHVRVTADRRARADTLAGKENDSAR